MSHDCDIDDLNKILDSKFYTISRSDDVLTIHEFEYSYAVCFVFALNGQTIIEWHHVKGDEMPGKKKINKLSYLNAHKISVLYIRNS